MNDKLYRRLLELPKENIINVMWEAIGNMEAYNYRTRTQCICLAIGGKESNDGRWKLPSKEKIIKNTKTMGL